MYCCQRAPTTGIYCQEGLCYNCLAHHKVSQFTSHRRCRQCNQEHHTILCPPRDTQTSPTDNIVQPPKATNSTQLQATNSTQLQVTNSSQPQASSSTQPQPSPATNSMQVPVFTAVANQSPLPASAYGACLLKTAISTVSAGPISTEGNILFDEGAQRSLIMQDLADRLCLKDTHTECISVLLWTPSICI